MDWNAAIEKNREALKRVLAMLVAMAGGAALTSPLWGGRREASGGGRAPAITPTRQSDDCRPPHKGEVEIAPRPSLPRHLHRAVLRLLRPAEAAVRRLVIVAARGLVVELPPGRPGKPEPASVIVRNRVGTGIVMPRHVPRRTGRSRAGARALSLPLFDTLRPPRSHRPPARCVPRILWPGAGAPFPVAARRTPLPGDPVDASRLTLRLQALGRALDDLPAAARRFARWQARAIAADVQDRAAIGTRSQKARRPFRRVSALRPGRPPGWCRRPTQDVHEILNVTHGLAVWALERADTS